jgi:hypothetical protein
MLWLPMVLALGAVAIPAAELDRDPIRTEDVADEATAVAKRVCAALQARDEAALLELMSVNFAGTAPGASAPLGRQAFAAALLAYLADARLIRRCSLKPFAFHTDRAHARAEGTFSFIIGALDGTGRRLGDRGDVQVALVREGQKLRLAAVTFEPRTRHAGDVPEFTEVTEELGLPRTFSENHEVKVQGASTSGLLDNGGLAVADYDGDGLPDLFVVRDGADLLFHNDGQGHFTEVAAQAGVADPGNGRSALFVDLDNDGDLDLVVVNRTDRRNRRGIHLYRNDGAGHFTDVTAGSGAGQFGYFTSVVAADVDGDGLLDLYVCQYGAPQTNHRPLDAHDGSPNLLLHNLGGLHFEEIGKAVHVAGSEWTLAAAFADLDGDRKPDLFVVNDYGRPRLYRNLSQPGQVRFEEVDAADGGFDDPGNGMGIDIGDYDGDGRLDVYETKMYSKAGNRLLSLDLEVPPKWLLAARQAARGNSLFRNLGGLKFAEVGGEAGVRRGGWAWSTEFADVDLDGDPDLFVTNGYHTGIREDDL